MNNPDAAALADLHQSMVKTQIEGLDFYIKKYEKLAGLTRTMGHEALALVLDRLVAGAREALEQTRALLASGVN